MNSNIPMLFLCVCSGAILWGIMNVVEKYYLSPKKDSTGGITEQGVHEDVMVVGKMVGGGLFALAVHFAFYGIPTVFSWFWGFLGASVALNVLIQFGGTLARKREDISIVEPLASSMPLWAIPLAWWWHGQWPTTLGKVGIICMLLGAYIIRLKGRYVSLPRFVRPYISRYWRARILFLVGPWLRLWTSSGARIALGVGFLGAIAVNFDTDLVRATTPMLRTGGVFLSVGVIVFVWSWLSGRWQCHSKQHFGKILLFGTVTGAYSVLMDAGFIYGIVVYVGALKRTQILWTVLLSGIILREKHTALRIVASLVILLGAVLMAF